jgi:hypothetical protein
MRNLRFAAAAVIVLIAGWAALLMFSGGWHPASARLDNLDDVSPDISDRALSCKRAFLPAPGIRVGMTCKELGSAGARLFADGSRMLQLACDAGHAIPANDAVFLPSKSLCGAMSPSDCPKACDGYR